MSLFKNARVVVKGYIHCELTEAEFEALPPEKREYVTRWSIPLPSTDTRKFKMTPYWYDKLFGDK
jgi:hypothetical protein